MKAPRNLRAKIFRWIVTILIFASFALIFYKIDFFKDHWILGTVPLWAPAIALVGVWVGILLGVEDYLYLFSCNNIPGNDSVRLIEFLTQKFGVDWVKPPEIKKIDDGKAINVYTGEYSFSLRLNAERNKVNLKIGEGKPSEFAVKKENDKLNIYDHIFSKYNMGYKMVLFIVLSFIGFVFGFLTYLGWIIITQGQSIINQTLLNLLIPMVFCFMAGCATYKFMELLGRLHNPGLYLFSWDNIPGKDNVRLKDFLKQNYCIHWVEPPKIQKIDDGWAINVSTENDFISLRLNDEKNIVNLKIDDVCHDELIAETENGERNIYQDYKRLYGPKTYAVALIKKFLKLLNLRL